MTTCKAAFLHICCRSGSLRACRSPYRDRPVRSDTPSPIDDQKRIATPAEAFARAPATWSSAVPSSTLPTPPKPPRPSSKKWPKHSSVLSLKYVSKESCHPERSRARFVRPTQSKDLRLGGRRGFNSRIKPPTHFEHQSARRKPRLNLGISNASDMPSCGYLCS
jgi:hypothetical protein